jgi:hypothetical protein
MSDLKTTDLKTTTIHITTNDGVPFVLPKCVVKYFNLINILINDCKSTDITINLTSKEFSDAIEKVMDNGSEGIINDDKNLAYLGCNHKFVINDVVLQMFDIFVGYLKYAKDNHFGSDRELGPDDYNNYMDFEIFGRPYFHFKLDKNFINKDYNDKVNLYNIVFEIITKHLHLFYKYLSVKFGKFVIYGKFSKNSDDYLKYFQDMSGPKDEKQYNHYKITKLLSSVDGEFNEDDFDADDYVDYYLNITLNKYKHLDTKKCKCEDFDVCKIQYSKIEYIQRVHIPIFKLVKHDNAKCETCKSNYNVYRDMKLFDNIDISFYI